VWNVDWILIIVVPAWRKLGEYMKLDRTFCCLLFKQEVTVAAAVTWNFLFPYGNAVGENITTIRPCFAVTIPTGTPKKFLEIYRLLAHSPSKVSATLREI